MFSYSIHVFIFFFFFFFFFFLKCRFSHLLPRDLVMIDSSSSSQALVEGAEKKQGGYSADADGALTSRETVAERPVARDAVFSKGQSRRIWGELYKVIDASDVVIQVPMYPSRCVCESMNEGVNE